jgi:hypothetical protein
MFRTTSVHYQGVYPSSFMVFYYAYKQSSRWQNFFDPYYEHLVVQNM